MFRYGRAGRVARDATLHSPAPDHVVCDAVCDAEQIVRRAWEATLLDRARRMESAVQAALANRDTADLLMTMARCNGDPGEIDTARANLHEATDLARRSSAAAQRIRHALLPELDLLARTHEQHACTAAADYADRPGLEPTAQPREPAAVPAWVRRFAAPRPRLLRGPAWWIGRLVRACATARRQR